MKILPLLLSTIIFFCACSQSIRDRSRDNIPTKEEILAKIRPAKLSENIINLHDHGAAGDSLTDCKPAFDRAMAWSKQHGGARIVVPAGTYIVNGPIHFVSNTSIDLQKGAKLIFSTRAEDYLPVVPTSWEGTLLNNYSPLIYAYQVENVAIIGQGIIDGNGKEGFSKWYDRQKPAQMLSRKMNHDDTPLKERVFGQGHFLRPQLIQFFECKNILIEGVSIHNSPFWCVHFLKSENITARKVKFKAFNKNNDGFDPEYSKNILIEDIDFDNADDNIAIKAGRDHEGRKIGQSSENIIIRNCRFKGLHAVVIGSEMSAGVQNVFVEDCSATGYCKRGLYLKSNPDRGGFIRNIFVKNLSLKEVEDALFITSFYHEEGKGHQTEIRDIEVENFRCEKANHAGLVIQGFPTKKVSNIAFSNVQIDSCQTAVSFSHTENIVFNDVVIGQKASAPSAVK